MSMFQFSSPSNPNPNQPAPSFGFGSSTSAPAATTTGFTFPTTGTGFGGLTSTGSNLSASPAPALFGTSTATPSFGLSSNQPTPSFGGGTVQPASNFGTNQPAASFSSGLGTTGGFNFGTGSTNAQPTATAFSTPSSQPAAAPLFGTSTSGFGGFSGLSSTTTTQPATSLAFSAPSNPATTGGFTFPSTAPTSSTAASVGFGFPNLQTTTTTQPAPAPATSTLFNVPPTTGVAAATTAPSFGVSGVSFGIPKTTLTTTSTAPIMSMPSTSVTSAVTTATVTPFKLPTPAATATTSSVASTTIQPTTTTMFTGLGGVQASTNVDPSQALSVGGGTVGIGMRSEERTIKESPLPVELIELVEELKTHIKSETGQLGELSRTSDKSIEKVSEACETVKQQLTNTSNLIHRQILNCDSLRALVDKDKKDAEMAQVTRDTPAALQHDHRLPYAYLFKLLQNYQEKMIIYKREILKAESALRSMENTNPLTSTDLCTSLKSTKDSLILLAAKVKTVHEQVVNEVETHRNLIRFVHGDTARDIFTDRGKNQRQTGPPSTLDKSIDYLSKTNILFPSKYPQASARAFHDYDSSPKPVTPQRLFHSTQFPNMGKSDTSTFNVSGYGQSLLSPIFPSQMTSSGADGSSLKRSKH